MTAGGIFPALLGTILLVLVALLASVPLGVAAAIYLSEYAPDNWFTRTINLAIINLAGVPSIVHALFGVGAFVIFFRFGTSILAAKHGCYPLANNSPGGVAECNHRHSHWCDPGSFPHGW
jgi:phosphate transport system permease protein